MDIYILINKSTGAVVGAFTFEQIKAFVVLNTKSIFNNMIVELHELNEAKTGGSFVYWVGQDIVEEFGK